MRVIIAGSRSVISYKDVCDAIRESGFEITELVSGHARGVDTLGEAYAIENDITITTFIPEWETIGRSAGILRNASMARYADALIAVWDGESKGTRHMIQIAKELGLQVYVKTV